MTTMKYAAALFFSLHLAIGVHSQVCDGNLGLNIFEDGDFGEGPDNILPNDPGIAPGYTYSRSGPPNDGLYVITNNTAEWPFIFPSWLLIRDNSPNNNGYMMVVNASFEPGTFYEEEVEGLCENTQYVFTADVINLIQRGATDHIKPNVTFLLDDVVQYTTGDIPQDEQWKTYGFVFETQPGQTSIKLSLQNNAPGGFGNDLALDNISFQACGPEALILPREIENICEDGSPIDLNATINGDQFPTPAVQWQESFDEGSTWQDIPGANGVTYQHDKLSAGFYYYRYLLANSPNNLGNEKCAIISNTKIVFVQPKEYTIVDSICAGNIFTVGSSSYTATGVYVDSLISSIGCDSIVTLDLTIVPDQNIQVISNAVAPTCFGFADASITVESVSNAYEPFAVGLTNLATNQPSPFIDLTGGDYRLSVVDDFGCRYEEEITIDDPAPFVIDLGPDTTVELGQLLNLSVGANYGISDFQATFSDSLCQGDCFNLEWYPTETNTYNINAISEFGCQAQDSITITVETNHRIYIPNVFSPNGDGVNDFFTAYGTQPLVQEIEQLAIFDRWGHLVFERSNIPPNVPEAGWQGENVDNQPQQGVYAYLVKVRFLDGAVVPFSGDVLLVN